MSPKPTNVAGLATITPAPLSAINAKKRPIPAAIDIFQAHRQRIDQHFTHFKEAEQDENDAGNENGTQSHTPVHAHAFDDGKGKVGVQTHAWRKGDRVVADKTHHETADGGGDTGSHKYCAHIHAGFAQNQGVDDDDVTHGEEGGQTGHDFSADVGLIGTQVEQSFQNALI